MPASLLEIPPSASMLCGLGVRNLTYSSSRITVTSGVRQLYTVYRRQLPAELDPRMHDFPERRVLTQT